MGQWRTDQACTGRKGAKELPEIGQFSGHPCMMSMMSMMNVLN
jgi:hypothetical protein